MPWNVPIQGLWDHGMPQDTDKCHRTFPIQTLRVLWNAVYHCETPQNASQMDGKETAEHH